MRGAKDDAVQDLGKALEYRFNEPQLLIGALTHPSVDSGRGQVSAFERLEFLGDRVLGLVVADMIFKRFPNEAEGHLARRQAALVRRESLARVARTLGIDKAVILSKSEDEGTGRSNPALLADACEAVLGAVYADGGLEPAAIIIRKHWEPLVAEAIAPPRDAKTALQEWAQGRGLPLPVYTVIDQAGLAHEPMFHVSVIVEGEKPANGKGTSKRAAEQAAAASLLDQLTR
ncbi:MAG TPA: ribonuclease III [Magnetospirillaceae bacterium]|jgi:ribonuclease-3